MWVIYKYELEISDYIAINIHEDHKILCIKDQSGKPCLWAEVNTETPKVDVVILCVGTGNKIGDFSKEYIDTYLMHGAGLVWHFYKLI